MRKFSILLVFVYVTVFSLYNFVIAADPASPFTPAENVQDPGDPLSSWGGCGPTDPNCYVTFAMPSSVAPTVDSDGEIAYDTTVADFSTGVIRFYGTEEQGIVAMPIGEFNAPTDGQIVSYNATNDEFELVTPAGVSADSLDYDDFEDTMDLDADTSIAEAAGLELTFNKTFTNNTSENGLVLNLTASDTGSATTAQYGFIITNSASTEGADALMYLNNADTDDSVADAIRIQSAAGTILTGIDFDDTDIVTDIELQNGETIDNNTNGTIQLTSTDVNLSGDLIVTGADVWVGNILLKEIGTRSLAIGGAGTPSVTDSLFFGRFAGLSATSASNSLFFGESAGSSASSADSSNFLGYAAGYQATSAENSNFIGYSAGSSASSASNSNFIGYTAGSNATNAFYSNFIGTEAGNGATNAGYSIFIGYRAGLNDTVNNPNSLGSPILIGYSTSTGGFSRSIAIGNSATNTANNQLVFGGSSSTTQAISSVFFGSGALSTSPVGVTINGSGASGTDIAGASMTLAGGKATGNAVGGSLIFQTSDAGASGAALQSLTTKAILLASGDFGIGDTTPDYLLDVEKTSTDGYLLAIHDSDGECLHDPEAGAETVTCSSDERLKTNIVDSGSVLDYLNGFRIRNYDVIASGDHMTGVIAQEVKENYPELVTVLPNGMYSVQLPNQWKLVKGIQELDLKLNDIDTILASFREEIHTKKIITETLCIGTEEDKTCITKDQLDDLLLQDKTSNEDDINNNLGDVIIITGDDTNDIIDNNSEENVLEASPAYTTDTEEIIENNPSEVKEEIIEEIPESNLDTDSIETIIP